MSVCYVTAFLDLNRENWSTFSRSFDDYFNGFIPCLNIFKKNQDENKYHLIIFLDKKHVNRVRQYVGSTKYITIIEIDEDYMKTNSNLWKRLQREEEIMSSDKFKKLVYHRIHCPETHNPKYTLINHAKVDFINIASTIVPHDYFCWIDFGYLYKPERVPSGHIDPEKFDKNKVNYTLLNPLSEMDKNYAYNLIMAPERIACGFFFGSRECMNKYRELYYLVHERLQQLEVVDDDQHIALLCYFADPDLFKLHYTGSWDKLVTPFQK